METLAKAEAHRPSWVSDVAPAVKAKEKAKAKVLPGRPLHTDFDRDGEKAVHMWWCLQAFRSSCSCVTSYFFHLQVPTSFWSSTRNGLLAGVGCLGVGFGVVCLVVLVVVVVLWCWLVRCWLVVLVEVFVPVVAGGVVVFAVVVAVAVAVAVAQHFEAHRCFYHSAERVVSRGWDTTPWKCCKLQGKVLRRAACSIYSLSNI